jgi:perosamine synthetase
MPVDMAPPEAFSRDDPVADRYQPPDVGELEELAGVLADGRLSGGAPILAAYEQALAAYFGSAHAVAVNSGSSALHAALHALGASGGAEVMVPAIAPLPTALPILTAVATPVVVDVLPGSLALDPDDVRRKLTARTRAALTVPLWGYPADCHAAAEVLADAGVALIEDAAQAHGTRFRGQLAGTLHTIGCFSTHDRKLLSTGEGGFVLTNDPTLYESIEHYTRLGHLRGHTHGVNYKLAAPLAAIGLRRLAHLDAQLRQRRANAARVLTALPDDGRLAELTYGPRDAPNYYNLVLTTRTPAADAAARLAEAGLLPDTIRYGYRPLHQQRLFARWASGPCPNAEALVAATLQLPVHPDLNDQALQWVARQIATVADQQEPS